MHAREGVKYAHFLQKDMKAMVEFLGDQILQGKNLDETSILNKTKYSMLEKTSLKLVPIMRTLK